MNGTVIAETVRRHATNPLFIVYAIIVLMVAALASMARTPGTLWPGLVGLAAIVYGAGLIGPEFSTGTLQLIVSKPVPRWTYLLSRVAGVIAVVGAVAAAAWIVETVIRAVRGAPLPWNELSARLVHTIGAAMLTVALLVLFGSLTRAWFNVVIYFLLQIGLSVAMAVLGLLRVRGTFDAPALEHAVAVIDQTLFPDPPGRLDAEWLLRVFATAAIALVFACLAFRRREVPYGGD